MTAPRRWEAALAGWGLPDELVAAAPADPWRLDPQDARPAAGVDPTRRTPADLAARDALPRGGSVLDVGCGPGGSSAPLRDRAGLVTGVDESDEMLAAFAATVGERRGLVARLLGRGAPTVRTVHGTWPDVVDEVAPADVVVCHNVLYNVNQGVTRFLAELTAHARTVVVCAITERHPRAWLAPYLEQLHGLSRPLEPTAATAIDLVREVTGAPPQVSRWRMQRDEPDEEVVVRRVARACAVGEGRLAEVRTALRRTPPPTTRRYAALVWAGTAV